MKVVSFFVLSYIGFVGLFKFRIKEGIIMKKSFLVTELLCFFLGVFGAHRYYTGYIGLGIAQTLTLGGCGIWSFIDFIFISLGKYQDAKGQDLEDYNKNIGIGALILVLALGIIKAYGPSSTGSRAIINNYAPSSSTVEKSVNEKGEQVLKFDKATCKITANSHFCYGSLTESDKIKLKQAQRELK